MLAFGALGAMGLACSTLFGKPQRYMRALAALVAFPIAFWSASLARQIAFELRTDGVVSSQMDSCTAVFMPLIVVVMSFVLVLLAEGYAALGTLHEIRRSHERLTVRTIFSRDEMLAIAVSLALGGCLGLTLWGDWRINQPCL